MGTSVNQRSPARPTWKLPQAVIGRVSVHPLEQSSEIWRAASMDPDTDIARRLSDPIIANACALAAEASSPADAIRRYDSVLNETRAAGMIFDLARRALARSVAEGSSSVGFSQEIFAETVGYYASRDLPSYVGKRGRISNASEIIALKKELQQHARDMASSQKLTRITEKTWSTYVFDVVRTLAAKRSGR